MNGYEIAVIESAEGGEVCVSLIDGGYFIEVADECSPCANRIKLTRNQIEELAKALVDCLAYEKEILQ